MARGKHLIALSSSALLGTLLLSIIGEFQVTGALWTFRINCGSQTSVTTNGRSWNSDRYSFGPSTTTVNPRFSPEIIYNTQRSGANFGYHIPGLPNVGGYLVTLYFIETVYSKVGERTFDIYTTDRRKPVVPRLDIIERAGGSNRPHSETFRVFSRDKTITFGFIGLKGPAQVCGILISQPKEPFPSPPRPWPPKTTRVPPPSPEDQPPPPSPLKNILSAGDFLQLKGCPVTSSSDTEEGLQLSLDRQCQTGSSVASQETFLKGTIVAVLKIPEKTTTGIMSSFYLAEEKNGREFRFDYRFGGEFAAVEVSYVLDGSTVDTELVDISYRKGGFHEYAITFSKSVAEFSIDGKLKVAFPLGKTPLEPMNINFEITAVDQLGPVMWSLAPFQFEVEKVYQKPRK